MDLDLELVDKGDMTQTEVRQKKKPVYKKEEDETTYFVMNVPTDVRRKEIWKLFEKYGDVTDVYYPGSLGGRDRMGNTLYLSNSGESKQSHYHIQDTCNPYLHLRRTKLQKIKYIGGVKILIVFDRSVVVRNFMINKDRWGEFLRWVWEIINKSEMMKILQRM